MPLISTKPIYIKPCRLNPTLAAKVNLELQRQVKLGLIELVWSNYALSVVIILKLRNKLWICTDFREVNKKIIPDRFLMPRIEDILVKVAGCRYLIMIDLTIGFQQLYLHPDNQHKQAFITPDGHWSSGIPIILIQHIRLSHNLCVTICWWSNRMWSGYS